MRVERDAPAGGPLVTGFAGTRFRVDGIARPGGVILTPESAIDWPVADLAALTEESLAPALALDPVPEFILLGTGDGLARPAPALVAAIERRGIGLEPMDSRAAARAWGLLRGEGRWIVAALLPLG